jgi:hypothetical protein
MNYLRLGSVILISKKSSKHKNDYTNIQNVN